MSGARAARLLPSGPGVRRLAAAGLVNAVGTGFFYAFALLFFEDRTGLSLRTIGTVLACTTLAVLPALSAVGRIADRFGPRPVLVVAALARAGCFVGFVVLPGLLPFVLLSAVLALGGRAEQTASPLLAVALSPEEERGRWLALSRVVFNAGMGTGALTAGLLVGPGAGFALVGLVNAASFVVAAALYAALPATAAAGRSAAPDADRRPARPYRDAGFVRIAAVYAMLLAVVLTTESALPVYALRDLSLPGWSVGLLFAVNTCLLTLLQLPFSRYLERFRPAAALAVGGLSYVTMFLTALLLPAAFAGLRTVLLVAAMVVYTLGEMVVSQAALVMLTSWPPAEQRGSYLAFNQVLTGVASAAAPLLATGLPTGGSGALWWTLTGICGAAALLALGAVGTSRVPAPQPAPDPQRSVS
ncbi:MFS transporter [Kitasatospora sp. NPDC096128]|uniref:MFS transporter n=1 Tax=Kitasatospora sp. NPDC096128 TaxID=3155547 RepID=UPI003323ED5A